MMRTTFIIHLGLRAALLATLATGCGGDDDGREGDGRPDTNGPVYAVCGFVRTPDGSAGYAAITMSLGMAELDLGEAIPVGGGVNCAAYGGSLFIGQAETSILTRYDVAADGSLTTGPELSFSGEGLATLAGLPDSFQFVSDTKAYFVDSNTQQVVLWNPADMTLIDAVPIDGLAAPPGQTFQNLIGAERSGDLIYFFGRYRTDQEVIARRTALVTIDTRTDAVTVDTTDQCGGISGHLTVSSGDVYLASNNSTAASHRIRNPGSFPPCMLRVRSGQTTFDPTFSLDLNALGDGAPTGGLMPGPNDSGYVWVYDEAASPIPNEATVNEINRTSAWRLWTAPEVGSSTLGGPVSGLPPGAGTPIWFRVDGVAHTSLLAADFTSSTVYPLTDPESVSAGLRAPGIVLGAFRIR